MNSPRTVALSYSVDIVAPDPSRVRTTLIFEVSSPYLKATSEWACVLKQSGKDDFEREIYGVDALQAVINSLFMLQTFIEQYRHKGHSVLYLGSDDELDISTYFSVFSLNKAEQGAAANP